MLGKKKHDVLDYSMTKTRELNPVHNTIHHT